MTAMNTNTVEQPMIELVAADRYGGPNSRLSANRDPRGNVRFDGVPAGRYQIRLREAYRGFAAGQVLSEVDVTDGATTEVFLHLVRA